MWNQAGAIVWAQWRSTRNHLPRANLGGLLFTGALTAVWYGAFAYMAVLAGFLLSQPGELEAFHKILPAALLLCFLYWQVIPVLLTSMGASLDLRKLLVYPIPKRALFAIEVILRLSTAVEMLLILTGAAIGLLLNRSVPLWAPFSLAIFVLFNLFCSTGVRDLLVRLLAHKRARELVVFLVVIAAALPQLMLFRGSQGRMQHFLGGEPSALFPWTATARLALGEFSWKSFAVMLAWTLAAYVFGRTQFERGLRFDAAEASARGSSSKRRVSRLEWWYQLPNAVFRDPLAALIEKELRFLSRAPRFRLVFLMGFSFGLLIWTPIAFGRASTERSFISDNYLTMVSVYALLLLSDALFWNCFGLDRSAAQVYFLVPVKMSTVLAGKNLAAAFLVLMEITAIALVCAAAQAASQRPPDSGSVRRHLRNYSFHPGRREPQLALQSARGESGEDHEDRRAEPLAGPVDARVSYYSGAGGAGLPGTLRVRYRVGIFRRVAVRWRRGRGGVLLLHALGAESRGRSPRADYQCSEQRRRPDRELMDTSACRFCQIAAHANYVVFEDALSIAFLDYRPLFIGHTLLIPKAHYETLADLPPEFIGPFFSNAQLLARAVEQAMQAEGSFVAINNRISPKRSASARAHCAAPQKGRPAWFLLAAPGASE